MNGQSSHHEPLHLLSNVYSHNLQVGKSPQAWHHPFQPQPAHTTGLCRKSLPRGRSSSEASGAAVLSPAPSSSGHRLGAASGVCRWHSLKQVSDWMSWQHFHISSCQLCSIQLHFLQVCWTYFPEQAHPCLASTRLQSITLHFEDKEGSTLELYLTGEGRLQDAHCKVSLGNRQGEAWTKWDSSQATSYSPFQITPSKPREEFRLQPAKVLASWASCLPDVPDQDPCNI